MQLEGKGERSAGEVVLVLKLGLGVGLEVCQQPVESVEQQASKEKIHTIHFEEHLTVQTSTKQHHH